MFQVSKRSGFTLIELLVTIAIVGILTAMLFPAVNMIREAARNTKCKSQLKNLGLAVANYESAFGHFPTNGWGYRWHGTPDVPISGFGQPGGWTYQVLSYIEQDALAQTGEGLQEDLLRQALRKVAETPIDIFYCPSRRAASVYPDTSIRVNMVNCISGTQAAKTDFAINAGHNILSGIPGPRAWEEVKTFDFSKSNKASGIAFLILKITTSDVADGTSNTALIGEKSLNIENYESGTTVGDDQTLFIGDDADNRRWGYRPPVSDWQTEDIETFGGPHRAGCNFVRVDGSIATLGTSVSIQTIQNFCNRADGDSAEYEQ